jgi:hypothetical protein
MIVAILIGVFAVAMVIYYALSLFRREISE